MKVATISLIIDAIDRLKAGKNVLVVANPRPLAFRIARAVCAVARCRGLVIANQPGAPAAAPWVYARGHLDEIELMAKDCEVLYDRSARFEMPTAKPARIREVIG